MTRARAVWIVRWNWIQTVRILVNVHLQIAVGAHQPPLRNDFPVCKQFDAVSSAAHLVACDKGDDDIGWSGAPFHKRRTRLCRMKIRVIIVEGRYIERKVAGCLHSITEFVREKIFGVELTGARQSATAAAAEDRNYRGERRGVHQRRPRWYNR